MKYKLITLLLLISTISTAQTEVSGLLSSSTVWNAANGPYIVTDDLTIPEGMSLTIMPGTVVKFNDFWDNIVVNGTLNAQGTAVSPVYFTSIHDDTRGGDTNNNGNATVPAQGQWSAIYVNDTGQLEMQHCWIGYGAGEHTGMVETLSNNVSFNNCTFSNSEQYGIYGTDVSFQVINSEFNNNNWGGIYYNGTDNSIDIDLRNNTFQNHEWAVFANFKGNATSVTLLDNISTGSNTVGIGRNGFGLAGSISGNQTFTGQSDFPFIVDSDFLIEENAMLTITENTVFKFSDYWDDIVVNGTLNTLGTEQFPVVFTSLQNDNVGGDTNGDGNNSSAQSGTWASVFINEIGSANFYFTNFSFGGGEHSALLQTNSSEVTIQDCQFENSNQHGIYGIDVSLHVYNSEFNNNSLSGIELNGTSDTKSVILDGNSFSNNKWAAFARFNSAQTSVVLNNNSSSGANALNFGRNGFGIVGNINGNVDFQGEPSFPFIVSDDFKIEEGAMLTFSPGTTIKFNDFWDDIVVEGSLVSNGIEAEPVVYTSLNDDAVGGDTNGDGTMTKPDRGQWASVFVTSSGSLEMNYSILSYGGGEHRGLINTNSNNTVLNNCILSQSNNDGIYVLEASIDVYNSNFDSNRNNGIQFDGFSDIEDVNIRNCTFNNHEWAIYSTFKNNAVSIYQGNNSGIGTNEIGTGHNGFGIRGTITGDQVFEGHGMFPFIVSDDFTISEGASLAVSPGTVFKFTGFWNDIFVNGHLSSIGTDVLPIYYTSIHDDSKAGDTNANGSDSEPAPDQWASVYISDTGSADFAYNGFYFGGGEHDGLIHTLSDEVSIDHCSFFHSYTNGITVQNASLNISNSNFYDLDFAGVRFNGVGDNADILFENNAFSETIWAVWSNIIDQELKLTLDRNLASSNNAEGKARNGWGIQGLLKGNSYIKTQDNFPLIIEADLTVSDSGSLEVAAGSIIKFVDFWDDLVINGSLRASGTNVSPIAFTSIQDDCTGGDTNGDEGISEPFSKSWSGIRFNETSHSNELHYCHMFFGNGEIGSMIHIQNSDVLIDNSVIGHADGNGIQIFDSNPTINNCTIHNNGVGINIRRVSDPVIEGCNFLNNRNNAVSADNPYSIGDNYWGSISGPYNGANYPDGKGEHINNMISLSNSWLENLNLNSGLEFPDFDVKVHGENAFMENTSSYNAEFLWILEDSDSTQQVSPTYSFERPGAYEICLQGSDNCHTPLENCKQIQIKGVSSYEPHVGGNSGTVTLNIGAGATSEIKDLILETNSGKTYPAIEISKVGKEHITALFDLNGKDTETGRIKIIYLDNQEYYADDAFEIVTGETTQPWVDIIGHSATLFNVWQTFDIRFGNDANVDAYGVPLWIIIDEVPGMDVSFSNVTFTDSDYALDLGRDETFYDTLGIYVTLDSLFGEPRKVRAYPFYLNMIPANQDFTIKMNVRSPGAYTINAWTNEPYFNSPFNGRFALCVADVITSRLVEFIPGKECANSLIGSIFKPTARLQDDNAKVFVTPGLRDYFNIAVDCGLSVFPSIKFAKSLVDLVLNIKEDVQALIKCKENFDPVDPKEKPVRIIQSIDPNEKIGPSGYGENNYIAYREELNYTIYFENKDDATAPAHTIVIIDTLDKSVYDFSSINIKEVQIGNNTLSILPNSKGYTGQLILEAQGCIARVNAELDTLSGVLSWTFKSLDLNDLSEVTDPFIGILPPNVNKPEGEGYVSFSIRLKDTPIHEFAFGNQAEIYFDANDPIVTDIYMNTFDLMAPESSVKQLETLQDNVTFNIEWESMDPNSGVYKTELWVSENGEAYELVFQADASINSMEFTGLEGQDYSFYTVSTDKVGNRESIPAVADATTMVSNTNDLSEIIDAFNVFPIPVQSHVTLDVTFNEAVNSRIYISDLLGREIKELRKASHKESRITDDFDIGQIEDGLYFITIESRGSVYSHKIIINNN